eukprot:CAMPEP_0118828638 /NCGR_PEP_ID=MMETSP1162-20130426/19139_1 /TAXON_ID=33656 /ORGANISM="Phaeocystis Sp, Strain CCMP2710" /LENGTH=147 /DNA_ID=CAMNT_0006759671 /DNA_START=25 /DNA_END=465 /DNA_ORIENTATION=+
MGKIIRGPEAWSQVKLSTKRVGGGGACSEEFAAYLTCLDKTQANEEECKTLREALRRCMYVASSGARTSRHVVPINYHLQKFIKGFKGDTASQYLFSASCASWMMMHRQMCALFTVTLTYGPCSSASLVVLTPCLLAMRMRHCLIAR